MAGLGRLRYGELEVQRRPPAEAVVNSKAAQHQPQCDDAANPADRGSVYLLFEKNELEM